MGRRREWVGSEWMSTPAAGPSPAVPRPTSTRWAAILRQRCPRCFAGKVYRGLLDMNETCPVCGLRFEREEGYFTGAMYISYLLSLVLVFAIFGILWLLLPNGSLFAIGMLCLVTAAVYLPLVPVVFRYSRVLYMHLDRKLDPDVDETAL